MSQIWFIFKHILKKYHWRRLRRRPEGAAAPWGGGILQNVLENIIFGSSYFQNRNWACFSKFHHLVRGASYHPEGPGIRVLKNYRAATSKKKEAI